MICQNCGQRPATTQYTQIINGKKQQFEFCAQCAAGIMGDGFPSILTTMFEEPERFSAWHEPVQDICPVCGMTRERLSQTGQAGCGKCYEVFQSMLVPYIRSIQGAEKHKGMTPSGPVTPKSSQKKKVPQPPANDLQAQLKKAIAEENYELAAELRDKIREGEGA